MGAAAREVESVAWDDIRAAVDHREWPPPRRGWSFTVTFRDHLFLHWPVPVSSLRPLVPDGLTIDERDGSAWLSVLSAHLSNIGPAGLPWTDSHALMVRTYVRRGDRAGFHYLRVEADNPLVVTTARLFFHLPYFRTPIGSAREGEHTVVCNEGPRRANPQARRGSGAAPFCARFHAVGATFEPRPGSLEHWLVERYGYFTSGPRGTMHWGDIHHRPWRLRAAVADIDAGPFIESLGLAPPGEPPLAHVAARQDLLTWTMRRVRTEPRQRSR